MKKSAPTKKKVAKKSVPAKKVVSSSRVASSSSRKSVPLHKRRFMAEHQDRLHQENPALKSLLYVMLAAMVVLLALLFIQGQSVGMW